MYTIIFYSKDNAKVQVTMDTKITKEEHYILVNEPYSLHIKHCAVAIGEAKAIKEAINIFLNK